MEVVVSHDGVRGDNDCHCVDCGCDCALIVWCGDGVPVHRVETRTATLRVAHSAGAHGGGCGLYHHRAVRVTLSEPRYADLTTASVLTA